jgi:hypothetical protein
VVKNYFRIFCGKNRRLMNRRGADKFARSLGVLGKQQQLIHRHAPSFRRRKTIGPVLKTTRQRMTMSLLAI